MQDIIKTYIRNTETNQPKGIAVAIKHEGKINYGFSLCNTRLDKWDKKHGEKIAIARALAPAYKLPAVKDREASVLDAFENLEKRCIKYFKDLPYEDVALKGHLGWEDVNV